MERLRRFFMSEKSRREYDSARIFLDANDSVDLGEEFETYFEFIQANPDNADAMRDLNEVWIGIEAIDDLPHPTASELASDHAQPTFFSAGALALSASLAALAIFVSYFLLLAPSQSGVQTYAYATTRGEQRPITLEDGSILTLGGASEVIISMSDQERVVELVAGETYLDVAPDKDRVFLVRAGAASIRAIGTEFSVNKFADGVSVAVSEGVVEVSASGLREFLGRLTAGEQIRLSRSDGNNEISAIEMDEIAAWRRGELILDNETLAHAVSAINRYYDGEISIDAPQLATMRVSGVIDIYDPAPWLNGLETVLPIKLQQKDTRAYVLTVKEEP